MRYVPQAAHAQDERRRSSCETWPLLLGFRFLDFVWEIHFRYRNAKIKLWKWKWTSANSTRGCFCVLCVMWAQFVACLSEFLVWCCSRCCSIYRWPKLKMREDDMTFAMRLSIYRLCMGNSLSLSKCENKAISVKMNFTWGCFCVLCVIWAQFVAALGDFLVRCCSRCCFST